MVGRPISWLLLGLRASVPGLWLPCAAGQEAWITPEDTLAAQDAKNAAQLYCEGGFKGEVDPEGGRDTLNAAVGGTNVLLEAAKESRDSSELGTKFAEKADPVGMVVGAGGTVLSIIFLIWWFLCCWTACPCCKRCRVCRGRKETKRLHKIVLMVISSAITFAVIFAASFAFGGYYSAVDGVDNMACTVGEMLDGALSGQENPPFLGMLPLLKIFSDIEASLGPTAEFMTGIRTQIDSTAIISESVSLASQTLDLLKTAFDNIPAEVGTRHHKCQFCDVMSPALAQTIDTLNNGVGTSLAAAREEVNSQLSPEMSKELQGTFREAAAPMTELKNVMRDTFGFFTDTDQFLQIRGHLAGDGPQTVMWIVAIIVIYSLALVASMMFAFSWFFCRETLGDSELSNNQGGYYPKYSKVTHRVSCCSWCCGWWFIILAFLVGGIFGVVSNVVSSVCLIMDDMDRQMLLDIGPAFGIDFSTSSGEQLLDIIDQCFVPSDPGANPALLDIIKLPENGTQVTMRKAIVGKVKDQIDAKFEDIDNKMNSNTAQISQNPEVVKLTTMLRENPIDMLMVVDESYGWQNDNDYKALFAAQPLATAFPSSVRCPDGVVSADVPTVGGQTIGGVQSFVTALGAYGTATSVRADCANPVVCDLTKGPADVQACEAGNRFVRLKQQILDLTNFRCDVFVNPTDGISDCDPLDMVASKDPTTGKTTYTSSCMGSDGKWKRKQKSCNLQEFVQYIKEFDTRINKTMTRLDTVVGETGSGISTGLKDLVNTYLLKPIGLVVDGVTCGFIAVTYRRIIDGLCYQSVVGFTRIGQSYTACGVLGMFVIILMYGLWRRTVDNVNENINLRKGVVPDAGAVDMSVPK